MEIDQFLIKNLEAIQDPGALLSELHKRFGDRMAIAASGQPTDTAIIALAVKAGVKKPRVYTTDTLRLFPETYAYFEILERYFKIRIERFAPPEIELSRMVEQQGEFLFFDSKEKQEYCCYVRKVLPNQKALDTLDAWVTGLRADQSKARAGVRRLEIIQYTRQVQNTSFPPVSGGETMDPPPVTAGDDDQKRARPILKVNLLAAWTEERVRDYLKANKIPNHPLMEKVLPGGWRYDSLGCILCTTPIAPHESRRAGRWRWFNSSDDKKECGLHLPNNPKL